MAMEAAEAFLKAPIPTMEFEGVPIRYSNHAVEATQYAWKHDLFMFCPSLGITSVYYYWYGKSSKSNAISSFLFGTSIAAVNLATMLFNDNMKSYGLGFEPRGQVDCVSIGLSSAIGTSIIAGSCIILDYLLSSDKGDSLRSNIKEEGINEKEEDFVLDYIDNKISEIDASVRCTINLIDINIYNDQLCQFEIELAFESEKDAKLVLTQLTEKNDNIKLLSLNKVNPTIGRIFGHILYGAGKVFGGLAQKGVQRIFGQKKKSQENKSDDVAQDEDADTANDETVASHAPSEISGNFAIGSVVTVIGSGMIAAYATQNRNAGLVVGGAATAGTFVGFGANIYYHSIYNDARPHNDNLLPYTFAGALIGVIGWALYKKRKAKKGKKGKKKGRKQKPIRSGENDSNDNIEIDFMDGSQATPQGPWQTRK